MTQCSTVTESRAFRRSHVVTSSTSYPLFTNYLREENHSQESLLMCHLYLYNLTVRSQLQFTIILLPLRIRETIGLKVKNLARILISVHVLVSSNEACTWDTHWGSGRPDLGSLVGGGAKVATALHPSQGEGKPLTDRLVCFQCTLLNTPQMINRA